MNTRKIVTVNDAEHATVIAALRFYQQGGMTIVSNRSCDIDGIATNEQALVALNSDEIDLLAEHLNVTFGDVPAVVIEMDCGAIHCVNTSVPMRVVVLDADAEGADIENLKEINGKVIYLHDFNITEHAFEDGEGIEVHYVADVLEQIDSVLVGSEKVAG